MLKTISFLAAAATVTLAAGPAAADELAQKEQTVMITATLARGGSVERGSGVLLCQQDDRVWVLTAAHVLVGSESWKPGKAAMSRRLSELKIEFFGNAAPPIVAKDREIEKRFSFYNAFKPDDLVLVSFPLAKILPSTVALAPEPSPEDTTGVSAVGYWKDQGRAFEHRSGVLENRRGTKVLRHTAEVREGFSGGPLFNEQGELIGVNVRWDPETNTGDALAVDHSDILTSIDQLVPATCLKSAGDLSELAHLTYRKAMRAVGIRDWKDAEKLMRQAVSQHGREGGSVHLEGMRFTRYLPHYHLGLALYKQQKWSDAIREWEISEAQGEIQQDKRFSTLRRLKKRSYQELQRRTRQTD
jgi:hypothetical protein